VSRWYALSTHFLTDEKVEVLGEQHGPAGPLVIVALLAQAKERNAKGTVEGSFSLLSKSVFSETDQAFDILSTAIKVGLVEGELTNKDFKVRFLGWNKWQSKAKRPAWKQENKGWKREYQNYREYLLSPEWAQVRERFRKSKLPQQCQVCKCKENLHLHHKTYARLYNERLTDLCWLCADCHDWVHRFIKQKDNKSRHNERTAVKTLRKRYERRGKRD
jgi:hypothetical protein